MSKDQLGHSPITDIHQRNSSNRSEELTSIDDAETIVELSFEASAGPELQEGVTLSLQICGVQSYCETDVIHSSSTGLHWILTLNCILLYNV